MNNTVLKDKITDVVDKLELCKNSNVAVGNAELDEAEEIKRNVVERPLMSENEFVEYLDKNRPMLSFEGVKEFKSVQRAIRRGLMMSTGIVFPKRPFNNRGNSSKRKEVHSREMNERKKKIYGKLKTTAIG